MNKYFNCVPKVPPCSKVEGNTKPPPPHSNPARHWVFTLFNYNEVDIDNICSNAHVELYAMGEETCPTSGRRHLQGYLKLKKKGRVLGLFKNKTIHWEISRDKANNYKKAILYTYKEKSAENRHWSNFKMPKLLKLLREDELYDWEKNILEIISTEPDDRTIHIVYGPTGINGKSTFCKYLHKKHGAFPLLGSANDMKNILIEYTLKMGKPFPEVILIDVPRSKLKYISWAGIEEIKNGFFMCGKYHGGIICENAPHVFVFCNELPCPTLLSLDRWHIIYLEDHLEVDVNIVED